MANGHARPQYGGPPPQQQQQQQQYGQPRPGFLPSPPSPRPTSIGIGGTPPDGARPGQPGMPQQQAAAHEPQGAPPSVIPFRGRPSTGARRCKLLLVGPTCLMVVPRAPRRHSICQAVRYLLSGSPSEQHVICSIHYRCPRECAFIWVRPGQHTAWRQSHGHAPWGRRVCAGQEGAYQPH